MTIDPVHQSRDADYQCATALADALEAVMQRGHHELAEIVDELNAMHAFNGEAPWNEASLRRQLAELGR